MNHVSKSDLIREISAAHGQTQTNVCATIDALLSAITAHASAGRKVRFNGFGTFEQKHSPARTGRNPRTGEAVEIEAKDILKFKASATRKA